MFIFMFFLFSYFQACPMCSETFSDPAALVAHFESSHSSDGRGSGIRNRAGTGTGKAGSECAMS